MKTNLLQRTVALVLAVTGYRFTKSHRQNESLLYRLLGTTVTNIKADHYVLARYNQIMGSICPKEKI